MMNRHRILANSLHEQLDSIKSSTSLPQMKYFIKKYSILYGCLKSFCRFSNVFQSVNRKMAKYKIPTINRMIRKSSPPIQVNHVNELRNDHENYSKLNEMDYEFDWASDFDDDDDDEEEDQDNDIDNYIQNTNDFEDSVDDDYVYDTDKSTTTNSTNQDAATINDNNLLNKSNINDGSKEMNLIKSSPISRHIRRPISDPPPPPLPKCPPPDLLDEIVVVSSSINHHLTSSMLTNSYELSMKSITNNNSPNNSNNDYLMPNVSTTAAAAATQITLIDKIGPSYRSSPNIPATVIDRPLPPIPRDDSLNNNDESLSLKSYPWFLDIERNDAETLLLQHYISIDGAFLVRKSRRAGLRMPYTLTLLYNQRIFHLNIRIRSDRYYALGSEKPREKTFRTIADMIEHHYKEPIYLTSKGMIAGKTTLILMRFDL